MSNGKTQKSLIGKRYGSWVIAGHAQRVGRDLRYPCQCECGTVRMVSAITLRIGNSTHCGCKPSEKSPRLVNVETQPTPSDVQEIFNLISQGCLPPADQVSLRDGSPSWTLPTIAKILGVASPELVRHLKNAGHRFSAFGSEAA